jgi:hypothetical protein
VQEARSHHLPSRVAILSSESKFAKVGIFLCCVTNLFVRPSDFAREIVTPPQ